MRFKVGDKVQVIRNLHGPGWSFVIGHVGTIEEIGPYNSVKLNPPAINGSACGLMFSVNEIELIKDGPLPLPG